MFENIKDLLPKTEEDFILASLIDSVEFDENDTISDSINSMNDVTYEGVNE